MDIGVGKWECLQDISEICYDTQISCMCRLQGK